MSLHAAPASAATTMDLLRRPGGLASRSIFLEFALELHLYLFLTPEFDAKTLESMTRTAGSLTRPE